jgi:hypothetical protein
MRMGRTVDNQDTQSMLSNREKERGSGSNSVRLGETRTEDHLRPLEPLARRWVQTPLWA